MIDLKDSKDVNGKYLMKYNFKMDDKSFVNENISFMVDSTGKVIEGQKISGIPDCANGDCDYSINESKAKQIAEASGGVFGYMAIDYEESKLIELKMIKDPAHWR